jgi:hypothetical protein
MSVPSTGRQQQQRLEELGVVAPLLPVLSDVDDWFVARSVAELVPDSRFATEVAEIAARLACVKR